MLEIVAGNCSSIILISIIILVTNKAKWPVDVFLNKTSTFTSYIIVNGIG